MTRRERSTTVEQPSVAIACATSRGSSPSWSHTSKKTIASSESSSFAYSTELFAFMGPFQVRRLQNRIGIAPNATRSETHAALNADVPHRLFVLDGIPCMHSNNLIGDSRPGGPVALMGIAPALRVAPEVYEFPPRRAGWAAGI